MGRRSGEDAPRPGCLVAFASILRLLKRRLQRRTGIGSAVDRPQSGFIAELSHAIQQITELPETWPSYEAGTRRYTFPVYPYSLIYRVTDDERKYFDLLRFSLAGSGIKMYQVHHYAYARSRARATAAFEKGFREVVGKCRQQRGEG